MVAMITVRTSVLFLAAFCGIEAATKTYYLPYRRGAVDYARYNLYNDGIRIDTTTSVVFKTKGKNDCHLLLMKDSNNYRSNVIEIVIGGWGNDQSVIRTSQQGSHRDTHKEWGLLSSSSYRSFWVSWANNCIKVGKGSDVGSSEFMGWCGLSHAINYLSIGYGYGSDGYFQFTIVQDGNWGSWGSYGGCSKSCGTGTQSRTRECNNPVPLAGGSNCAGPSSSSQNCNTQPCETSIKTYHLPYRSGGVDYTRYNLHHDGIHIDATTSIVFKTKGKNDCHLLLQKDSNNYRSNVIEIVIGGWSNGQSVIRTSQQGYHRDTHKEWGLLSSSSYRTFWISWASNCIKVGKGPEVGSSEFMGWCGLSHAINYLSIGYGYGSDGYFQFTIVPPIKTYHLPYRSGGVDYTLYDLYGDGIRIDTTTSIIFKTKGKNDCHLLLQKDYNNYRSNVIEIVIGGWSNGQSVIRTSQQGSHRDTHKESGILSSSSYRTFWISWANNCIKVGKGSTVGTSEFMGWCGLSHAINYLSIGYGYGSEGYFQFTTDPSAGFEQTRGIVPKDTSAELMAVLQRLYSYGGSKKGIPYTEKDY